MEHSLYCLKNKLKFSQKEMQISFNVTYQIFQHLMIMPLLSIIKLIAVILARKMLVVRAVFLVPSYAEGVLLISCILRRTDSLMNSLLEV